MDTAEIVGNVVAKILSDRRNSNCIIDLVNLLQFKTNVKVLIAALKGVRKVFVQFIAGGSMIVLDDETLDESAHNKYAKWLVLRYAECVQKLVYLFDFQKSRNVQELSLCVLMKFVEAEGCHLKEKTIVGQHYFPYDLLKVIIEGLLNGSARDKLICRFQEFVEYDDVRVHLLLCLDAIVKAQNINTVSDEFVKNAYDLLLMINLPSRKEYLSARPPKKVNFGGGDAEQDDGDELEDGESQLEINTAPSVLCLCLNEDGADAKEIYGKMYWKNKKVYSSVWTNFLRFKFSSKMLRQILLILDSRVLPVMDKPLSLADFLTDSYDLGGVFSILALNSLFVLMHKYNLEYPDFYTKLYSLFNEDLFRVKHRGRFFKIADVFLSSTHLPEYLLAAFAKRLSRLALTAPPNSALLLVYFVINILVRNPTLEKLVQNYSCNKDMTCDPYVHVEKDPAKCRALESSLWEVRSLQAHYYPEISRVANMINKSLPVMILDLNDVLAIPLNDMIHDDEIDLSQVKVADCVGSFSHALAKPVYVDAVVYEF